MTVLCAFVLILTGHIECVNKNMNKYNLPSQCHLFLFSHLNLFGYVLMHLVQIVAVNNGKFVFLDI